MVVFYAEQAVQLAVCASQVHMHDEEQHLSLLISFAVQW